VGRCGSSERVGAFGDKHFAFGSIPVSSSKVESGTPVHSAQDARPCSACTLAWIGSFENIGALLPPHSTKVMRDTIG